MPNERTAVDVMTRRVVTIGQDEALEVAIDAMIDHAISCLPVVSASGLVVGMLTQGDILRRTDAPLPTARPHWLKFLTGTGRTPRHISRKVCDVMTRSVISAPAEASLKSLAALMKRHRIQQVPIIERGTLAGLVSHAALLESSRSFWAAAPMTFA